MSIEKFNESVENMKFKRVFAVCFFVLCMSVTLSLMWDISSIEKDLFEPILIQVRVPRILLAMLTGMGLTLAGHMFQTLLNNPLADSFTLGLSSGATFGSGLAVVFGLSFVWLPIFSIMFSVLTLIIVLTLTMAMSKGYPMRTLILSGIMVGALFNAFLYVLIIFNEIKLNNIINYMFGGFSSAEYHEVVYISIVFILSLIILLTLMPSIKLLQLGELSAKSLGLNVTIVTYGVLLISSVLTAVIVAFVGIIGFIGMVIPQIVRRQCKGFDLTQQMILNVTIGGIVMVIADWIGGSLFQPLQIPASIVMALLGIPVLFYMMVTEQRS